MEDNRPAEDNVELLKAEVVRLNKIVNALMNRAEREMGQGGTEFSMFQATVTLERQVQDRTRALNEALQENQRINRDLQRKKEAQQVLIDKLEAAQQHLIQSEKLASLGSLVAGVAHELNTPIGNGVMSISTLRAALHSFRVAMANGLKRSALEAFLSAVDTGSDIAERNLRRAADLISSFKQVAVDQTSSQRREFVLDETVSKILRTIQPSLKSFVSEVCVDIPPAIKMNSYPGPLAQVIGNLIGNAAIHGFEGRAPGRVAVDAVVLDVDHVRIRVSDDGIGIPDELLSKIFDPFVTTKMGRGGTGLGLSIVQNIVAKVLGGSVSVSSVEGGGSVFTVDIPLVAPAVQGKLTAVVHRFD